MKQLLKKVELYGEKSLSDLEILFVLLGKKNIKKAFQIYEKAKERYSYIYDIEINDLIKKYKLTKQEALRFRVMCEFSKRFNGPISYEKIVVKSSDDIFKIFNANYKYEKNEILKVVILNNKNIIKRVVDITNGKNDGVTFDIKTVLLEVIKTGYNKIILVHNHPSGDSTPSAEDKAVTEKLKNVSELIGIKLLDHIIIGDNEYTSVIYG